jgi:hypothetical protein
MPASVMPRRVALLEVVVSSIVTDDERFSAAAKLIKSVARARSGCGRKKVGKPKRRYLDPMIGHCAHGDNATIQRETLRHALET